MPLRIDSKAAIRAMIGNPATFPTVAAALDKDIARYLAAHFRDKGMGIDRLRATHDALGDESLALILDALDGKTVAALLKKADPHRAAGDPDAGLPHLKDLASGSAKPQPKPEKPRKAVAPRAKPALTRAGADKAAAAKGSGTRPTRIEGIDGAPSPPAGQPAKRRPRAKATPSVDR